MQADPAHPTKIVCRGFPGEGRYFFGWRVKFTWRKCAAVLGQLGCIGSRRKLRCKRGRKSGYGEILRHKGAIQGQRAHFLRKLRAPAHPDYSLEVRC